MKYTRMK